MTSGPRQDAGGTVDVAARIMQCVLAGVLTVISVILMVTVHRIELTVGSIDLPIGLLLAAAVQVIVCVFLLAVTGSRLPVLVLACLWGILMMPFAGRGAGGGVLMPAELAGEVQYSGWILQGLGLLIPFAVLAGETLRRRR